MKKKSPQQSSKHLWAVIMAGGAGTRFWPESREKNPKQFLPIFGRRTLLEETVVRIEAIIPKKRILVITNQRDVARVAKLARIPKSQVIGESIGRNTAPCAALAAAIISKKDPEGIITLLPADHRIGKPALFRELVLQASALTDKTRMPVTFGIKPAFAHTGYGYLEMAEVFEREKHPTFLLKKFHEKPDHAKADLFIKAGNFLWNSGMFVWKAEALLDETRRQLPEVYSLTQKMIKGKGHLAIRAFRALYPKMPSISIDYGIMEKLAGRILTIPCDLDWHDLGGWQAMPVIWGSDAAKNSSIGRTIFIDSTDNIVRADKKMIALLGVNDMVVVDTEDALLVCHKSHSESIRKIVQRLKDQKLEKYL